MKEKRRGIGMKLCMIQILLSCTISGCNDTPLEETQIDESIIEVQEITENSQENVEEIIEICVDLYKDGYSELIVHLFQKFRAYKSEVSEQSFPLPSAVSYNELMHI